MHVNPPWCNRAWPACDDDNFFLMLRFPLNRWLSSSSITQSSSSPDTCTFRRRVVAGGTADFSWLMFPSLWSWSSPLGWRSPKPSCGFDGVVATTAWVKSSLARAAVAVVVTVMKTGCGGDVMLAFTELTELIVAACCKWSSRSLCNPPENEGQGSSSWCEIALTADGRLRFVLLPENVWMNAESSDGCGCNERD